VDQRELVTRLSGDFGVNLSGSLPRIAEALDAGQAEASFSVTVQFKIIKRKGEIVGYKAEFKPRERVPLEPKEYKLSLANGQLSLFQGEPAEPDEGPYEPDPE